MFFKSFGHAVTAVAHDIVVGARAVEHALAKVLPSEKTVESITALVDPQAVPIEQAAYFLLGEVLHVLDSLDAATAAKGFNIQLDSDTIQKLKQLASDFKLKLASLGVKF